MDTVNSFQATLTEKKKIAPDTYLIIYEADKDIKFKAGQFMTFQFEGGNRAYSIASSPSKNRKLEFVIRLMKNGFASKIFKKAKVGDQQKMLGPAGMFTVNDNDKPKVFLATGVGIAPLRSMIGYLYEKKYSHQFILIWGCRYERDVLLVSEWEEVRQDNAYFDYLFCISREEVKKERFFKGYVQQGLQVYIERNKSKKDAFEYYVCGGGDNVKSVIEFLRKDLSIGEESIFAEQFS